MSGLRAWGCQPLFTSTCGCGEQRRNVTVQIKGHWHRIALPRKQDASDCEASLPGCATVGPTPEEAGQVEALVVEMDWATTNRTWFPADAARTKLRDAA